MGSPPITPADRGLHSAQVIVVWTRSTDAQEAEKLGLVSAFNDCLSHI